MNGEVVHALLALFDKRVAVKLPRQVFGLAADFGALAAKATVVMKTRGARMR
jgi:hypothetical protein